MLVKTYCAAVNGLEVTTVTVEVSITRGVLFHLTGLADTAVKESRDRISAALLNNGYKFPVADVTANLAPADLKKEGAGFDLPLAIAILAANEEMHNDMLDKYMLVGELGLDGKLQPVKGALPIAIKARAEHFKGLIVPKENEHEAAVVDTLEVYGMNNLLEVINFLNGASHRSHVSLTQGRNSMNISINSIWTSPMSVDRRMSREPLRWPRQADTISSLWDLREAERV